MKIKKYGLVICALIMLASCRKSTVSPSPVKPADPPVQPPAPVMIITDLAERSIKMQQGLAIDLNKDDKTDVVFYTQYVADNLYDIVKQEYMASSTISSYLNFDIDPMTGEDRLPALNKGDVIREAGTLGEWYNVGTAMLMRRVENNTSRVVSWQGNWINKGHLYLPVKLLKDKKKYFGWIELAADNQQERLVLYRAAISTEPDKEVRAGE